MTPDTPAPREPYGRNISRLVAGYPGFVILTGFEGFGYRARQLPPPGAAGNGKGYVGTEMEDLTLDGLAALMDARLAAQVTPQQVAAIPPGGTMRA
jgi:hypothetical protein